jgi:hypothetical protein
MGQGNLFCGEPEKDSVGCRQKAWQIATNEQRRKKRGPEDDVGGMGSNLLDGIEGETSAVRPRKQP